MSEIEVTGLTFYPIKSCSGIDTDEAKITSTGIQYDRQWMVVNADGQFMSQRKNPELALVYPQILTNWGDTDVIQVSGPSMPPINIFPDERLDDTKLVEATVHGKPITGQEVSTKATEWFSTYLGQPTRLLHLRPDLPRYITDRYRQVTASNEVGFADGFPLTLASEASLREINANLVDPAPISRFRPNILIDGAELEPYEEDYWRYIRIGSMGAFVVRACSRCEITDTNQLTAQRGTEVRRALSHLRRGIDLTEPEPKSAMFFMQNLVHELQIEQIITVGDTVKVEERATEANIKLSQ